VKSAIVANSPTGGNCLNWASVVVSGANLATDGTCPGFTQVTPIQLNLGPLALNPPGTTATHALLPGSVAIDAASDCNDFSGNPVTADQRGVPRPQGSACEIGAYERTSGIDTVIYFGLTTAPATPTGASVTMGAFVHDKAMVTSIVNNIPFGSSVTFNLFQNASCSGTPAFSDTVNLTGGTMAESAASSGVPGARAFGPLAVGAISYQAVFNSGDTNQVPSATSACEPLQIQSSISRFVYHLDPDHTTAYNCTLEAKIDTNGDLVPDTCPAGTQEASVAVYSPHSYEVHVQVTNATGLTITERVKGALAAGKSASYSGLAVDCGVATISGNAMTSGGKTGNQVNWNATGSTSNTALGFTMTPGQVCTLRVTVTNTYNSIGEQPITGSWSEVQTEVSPINGSSIKMSSPGTGQLSVNVTP